MAETAGLSKSAKQRLAKKARDEAHAKEAAEKAAAEAAAAAAAAPPAPKAQAKAAGYPGAKAAAAAPKKAAAPAASNDGWTEATAKSKSKKGGAKSPAVAPAAAPAEPDDPHAQYDDGTGGDWEISTSTSNKKKERQPEKTKEAANKKAEEERAAAEAEKQKEIEKARALKHAAKAAKNGTAPPAPAPESVAPAKDEGAKKPIRPEVQASIAAVAKQAKEAAAAAKEAAAKSAQAKAAAASKKEEAPAEEQKPEEPDNCINLTIQVPEEKIGIVVGPKYQKLRDIEEKTGVVSIDNKGTTFTIRGEPEKVPLAEKAIKDLMTKGYMELSFTNFTEASVMINSLRVPDIVGKGGEIIRVIKNKCNVEVNIPKTPAGGPKSKGQKIKVDIAGSAEGVALCKEIISNIIVFFHHEITHPCAVHAELDVPAWANSLIIGKGGGEMRHIQSNFCVKVYIPREGESDNKNVVIVGSSGDVAKAKEYIQKKISDAEAEWNDPSKKKKAEDKN